MSFIHYIEKEVYGRRLPSIVASNVELDGAALDTHRVDHVPFTRSYDKIHLLTIFRVLDKRRKCLSRGSGSGRV